MKNYIFYECIEATFWLPHNLTVEMPLPRFFANGNKEGISVDLTPEDVLWEWGVEGIEAPLPSDSSCELTDIRRGKVNFLYTGYERIIQSFYPGIDQYQFNWDILLEDGNRKAIIGIFGPGKFSENEEKWEKAIQSFRFK